MTYHPQTETLSQSSRNGFDLWTLSPTAFQTDTKCEALLAVACSHVRHITLHSPATEGLMISYVVAYVI